MVKDNGMENIQKFEVGREYFCRSACDHTCVWTFKVVRRTAKSIWFSEDGCGASRRSIRIYNDIEMVYPMGTYSMSPVLSADKVVA